MRIVTDSAADLTQAEIEAHAIHVEPLKIQFPQGEVSSNEITADAFYNQLEAMQPDIPTTSQPSAGAFSKIYHKLTQNGEDVLSIHISSGLSGTVEAARLAARQINDRQITVVDSLTLSGGQRFQVLAAARLAEAGRSTAEILDRLSAIREQTEVAYTLETLTYLARGGRIGRVQAIAGALLRLKPIITVDKQDGKYNSSGKERTIKRALEKITRHFQERYEPQEPLWVTILHGRFHEQAERLAEMAQSQLNVGKLEILRISPVLGVHTGPGIVGAAVVPLRLMPGENP